MYKLTSFYELFTVYHIGKGNKCRTCAESNLLQYYYDITTPLRNREFQYMGQLCDELLTVHQKEFLRNTSKDKNSKRLYAISCHDVDMLEEGKKWNLLPGKNFILK